jgi:hypothetical protein
MASSTSSEGLTFLSRIRRETSLIVIMDKFFIVMTAPFL